MTKLTVSLLPLCLSLVANADADAQRKPRAGYQLAPWATQANADAQRKPRAGYQLAPWATQTMIDEAIGEGANIIRYQIHETSQDVEIWMSSVVNQLHRLDSLNIPVLVVIDLHNSPGSIVDGSLISNLRWFWSKAFEMFPSGRVFGILNEPALSVEQNNIVMRHLHRHIRTLSKDVVIAVSTAYGSPENMKRMAMFKDAATWYEAHSYWPMKLTHSGVYGNPVGAKYPALRANRFTLRFSLRHLFAFKKRNPSAQVYIGEFSCSHFVDPVSRATYIRDSIALFKKLRAHWTYHAFLEAEMWHPSEGTLDVLRNNMQGES